MSSERELDEGIKSIKSAWRREHTARANLEKLLEQAEAENAKLKELCADMLYDTMENICSKAYWCNRESWQTCSDEKCGNRLYVETARELGVEVGE